MAWVWRASCMLQLYFQTSRAFLSAYMTWVWRAICMLQLYFQSSRKYGRRSYGALCLSMSIVTIIVAVIGIVSVAAYLGGKLSLHIDELTDLFSIKECIFFLIWFTFYCICTFWIKITRVPMSAESEFLMSWNYYGSCMLRAITTLPHLEIWTYCYSID